MFFFFVAQVTVFQTPRFLSPRTRFEKVCSIAGNQPRCCGSWNQRRPSDACMSKEIIGDTKSKHLRILLHLIYRNIYIYGTQLIEINCNGFLQILYDYRSKFIIYSFLIQLGFQGSLYATKISDPKSTNSTNSTDFKLTLSYKLRIFSKNIQSWNPCFQRKNNCYLPAELETFSKR